MTEKNFKTEYGTIHYWVNEIQSERASLIFLPGLTADHRLFEKQVEAFCEKYNVFVWDAPSHNASRPFRLEYTLEDKACWLHEILETEHIIHPILVGQSMGGYLSQMYMELFPGEAGGFVCIDSAPLQRKYVTSIEIWLLKHCGPIYKMYPWNALKKAAANGCAMTAYGRRIMWEMLDGYSRYEYCALAAFGYRMLAEAMEKNRPYQIDCPAVLICGTKDRAGSCKSYSKRWTKETGIRLEWIEGAGHNSNTDAPERVNALIEGIADMSKK